jgi:chromosome segregation ATPase
MKFKNIILASRNRKLELANINEFITEFDKLKNTYLDKPLDALQKEIDGIRKANSSIQDAVGKINTHCDNVISKYLNDITDKLDKYYKGIIKSYKKNLNQK